MTDHLRRPVIGAENSPFAADGQVAHRRLFVEIAIATFALQEPFLGPEPFQLRGGPRSEDPENEQPARFRRHRPVVKHGQMTENLALAVQEGDAHVAVNAQTDQRGRVREVLRHTRGVMNESPAHDGIAGSRRKIVFHVLDDPITRPKGDGAHPRIHVGELGDDGVGNVDGRSQSAHQRPEELFSRAAGRPFDDIAQCAEVVANPQHIGTVPIGKSQSGLVHVCKQSLAVTRLDAHKATSPIDFLPSNCSSAWRCSVTIVPARFWAHSM